MSIEFSDMLVTCHTHSGILVLRLIGTPLRVSEARGQWLKTHPWRTLPPTRCPCVSAVVDELVAAVVSLTLGKKRDTLHLDVSLHSGNTDDSSNLAFRQPHCRLEARHNAQTQTPKTVCRKVRKKRSGTPSARLFSAEEPELPCIGKWDGVGRRSTKKARWRIVTASPNVSATFRVNASWFRALTDLVVPRPRKGMLQHAATH